jgi:hypothetical protein
MTRDVKRSKMSSTVSAKTSRRPQAPLPLLPSNSLICHRNNLSTQQHTITTTNTVPDLPGPRMVG